MKTTTKKILNDREREVASVMADLFLKGTPEQRIAEYCLLKNMTPTQVHLFLGKLVILSAPVCGDIYNKFMEKRKLGEDFDASRQHGKKLREWLDSI